MLVPTEEHVSAAVEDVDARLLLLRHLEAALPEARLPALPRLLFGHRVDVLIDHSSPLPLSGRRFVYHDGDDEIKGSEACGFL